MKTAIVTGASGNLGKAVAQKFIAEGFKVIGAVTTIDSITGLPEAQFEPYVADLADETQTIRFVANVIAKYKNIDAAILTVGGFAKGNIDETGIEGINQQIKLNFETAYNIARPVFNQMLKQKSGRIFMIGSKPGLNSANSKGMVAYGLSKSLLFRLAELMNDEAKGTNVVTTVVVPSTIDTPQNRKSMPGADFDKWVKPELIADVIFTYTTDNAAILREPILKVYNNA